MYDNFTYPTKMVNVKRFFFEEANFIRRDFENMLTMQNKMQFAKKRIDFFHEKIDAVQEGNGCKIVFDGQENFKRGISLFSLYAIFNDGFVVFMPIGDITYSLYKNFFFVNDKKIQVLDNNVFKVAFDNSIPASLICAWMFSNAIDVAVIQNNNDFKKFLSQFKNINNQVFFKDGADALALIKNSTYTV
jgi:hypothetical protein